MAGYLPKTRNKIMIFIIMFKYWIAVNLMHYGHNEINVLTFLRITTADRKLPSSFQVHRNESLHDQIIKLITARLRQGNAFTGVCLSKAGGVAFQHASQVTFPGGSASRGSASGGLGWMGICSFGIGLPMSPFHMNTYDKK